MKQTILIAKVLSTIFRPSYYPTVGIIILLSFTYLRIFPWTFKLWILALVYIFTFALPALGVFIYRRLHGWSRFELRKRHKRAIPYDPAVGLHDVIVVIFVNVHFVFLLKS